MAKQLSLRMSRASGLRRGGLRGAVSMAAAIFVVCGLAGVSPAQDVATARTDVTSASDFRVRVSAALVLGRAHAVDSRALLERALGDSHPAVRAAAAAGLAALGDAAAIPALQRRLAAESSGSVQSQMRSSIEALRPKAQPVPAPAATAALNGARYVVQIGSMKNNTPVRGDQLGTVMRTAAKTRAAALPGAMVMDGNDADMMRQAGDKRIPVLLLDGTLTRLLQGSANGSVTIQAQVEFSVSRVPEHILRGTLSGAATSVGASNSLSSQARVTEMQNEAVNGAVESAMGKAGSGLARAAAK